MINEKIYNISLHHLHQNPKNSSFFTPLSPSEIESLKRSIVTHGVIEPLLINGETNMILDGNNRFELAKQLGLSAVPCRKFFGDVQAELELIITRNEVRRSKEVNPIRLSRQINAMKAQFGIKAGNNASSQGAYTMKELAVFFGKSIKHLNKLASLSKLHPELATLCEEGKIGVAIAYRIVSKYSEPGKQLQIYEHLSALNLSKQVTQKEFDTKVLQPLLLTPPEPLSLTHFNRFLTHMQKAMEALNDVEQTAAFDMTPAKELLSSAILHVQPLQSEDYNFLP